MDQSPSRSVEDPKVLHRLLEALEEFRRLDPEMPIQRACYLLWTALHQPCTQVDVGVALRISEAARSRNKDLLADFKHGKTEPLGLILCEQSAENRSANTLTLTAKGVQFLKRVALKLKGS